MEARQTSPRGGSQKRANASSPDTAPAPAGGHGKRELRGIAARVDNPSCLGNQRVFGGSRKRGQRNMVLLVCAGQAFQPGPR